MNRFTYAFGLRIDRTHLLVLAFAFLAVTIIGCTPSSIIPLGAKLQNADSAFDEAEATEVRDDDPEKMEKNRMRQQEHYDKAMALYLEVIERAT